MLLGKRLGLFSLLPFLMGLSSAMVSSTPAFSFTIGPCVAGENLHIDVAVSGEQYLSYYAFIDATGVKSELPPTGLICRKVNTLEENKKGMKYLHGTLGPGQFAAGYRLRIRVGICMRLYRRTLDLNQFPFTAYKDIDIDFSHGLLRIAEDGEYQTRAKTHYFYMNSSSNTDVTASDSYDVTGVATNKYLSNRKLPLSTLSIFYTNPYVERVELAKAELRILSYKEDFEGIAKIKNGYASIPLKATISSYSNGYKYRFALEKQYWYSRIDLSGYQSALEGVPGFYSSDLFLPLRQGHDSGLYNYQIYLEGVGGYDDIMVIDNSVLETRSYFGDCLSSDYCVVIGGES